MSKVFPFLAAAACLSGCLPDPPREEIPYYPSERSATEYGRGRLVTVEHDKHWFVTEGYLQKGGILHHPDCPCGKTK